MTAKILDGRATAEQLCGRLACAITKLRAEHDLTPGLAVVLVGEDPASRVYVRNKSRQAEAAGMHSVQHRLPEDTGQAELLALIEQLNADPAVHGILVQLPLPKQIDTAAVLAGVRPDKDVDGFHVQNSGNLLSGGDSLVPCTPTGCMLLLDQWRRDVAGLHALVIGRSNIVGKPVALLLLQRHCTVTIAHSRSRDLPGLCRQADILIAAVGIPNLVQGDWVKPGACVIDVGINRVEESGAARLVGDVDYAAACSNADAITPVPGGVGPMTIACLLRNTIIAACRQHRVALPPGLDRSD